MEVSSDRAGGIFPPVSIIYTVLQSVGYPGRIFTQHQRRSRQRIQVYFSFV